MPVEEKHGRGVEQAWWMLDTFASLGVQAFDVTETDIDGHKQDFRACQRVEQLRRWVPYLMQSATERQHNIIVRPKRASAQFVQLDDLSGVGLGRLRTTAFLILRTSPENHQAWIAMQDCDADLARRLRRGSGADPSASGATRVAGSLNFKRRYAPDFPMVTILEAAVRRTVTRVELEALGLVAAPDPRPVKPTGRGYQGRGRKQWPSYLRAAAGEKQQSSRGWRSICLTHGAARRCSDYLSGARVRHAHVRSRGIGRSIGGTHRNTAVSPDAYTSVSSLVNLSRSR